MDEATQTPKRRWYSPAKDLFTEKDGESWDFVRVFGALSILWFMGNVSFSVYKGQVFSPESVAIGLSTLLAAVSGGVAVRSWSKSENT
jgi:hypothetical protein